MQLKREVWIALLISLVLLVGCEQIATGSGTITNFEDLKLSELEGQTITVRGEAVSAFYDFIVTGKTSADSFFLRDSDGFDVRFVPRGERHITEGETYTIKGIVTKGINVYHEIDSSGEFYYVQEIKP